MVLSLFYFYHLDMVELVNTLRLGRRDREFESLYPDIHSCRSFGTAEANVHRCKLGIMLQDNTPTQTWVDSSMDTLTNARPC